MASRIAKGSPIVNVVQLAPEERVTAILTVDKFEGEGNLFMATKLGTVKKTPISNFANIRKSGIIAIGLDKGDELGWVSRTSGKDDIIMSTQQSMVMRFAEVDVRPMGRSARGVRGIRLKKGDEVVGMDIVAEKGELLVVMKNGYGKRTALEQFTPHHRGGIGIKGGVVTNKTGNCVDVRVITSTEDDLMIISNGGQIIRVPLSGVSKIGRATQGVRIMKLPEGEVVSSVALVHEPEEENEQLAIETE